MYTVQFSYIISEKGNPLIARCFKVRIRHTNIYIYIRIKG